MNSSQNEALHPLAALGSRWTYSYDANGNQTATRDPLGNRTTTTFDAVNREIGQVDPLDRRTKTAYDLNGNVIKKTDPLGNATTSEYDAEGRLVKQTDPLAHETVSGYDAAGQLVAETDPNGHTTRYDYDVAGQKTSVTAPGGSITSYDYDANGNVLERTDTNGHATTYSYDAAGNKLSKTNPLGRSWTYSYDPSGNLIQTKIPSGGTISQAYDAENRLLKKSYSDATPTVSYTYDPAGNKLSMADGAGTTHYAYDAADQPVSAMSPSGGFLYSYDLNGDLLSRSYPNTLETSYSYNDASEMVTATVKSETTLYSHDGNGNLASTLHPSGILDERSYDAAGRLTGIKGTDSRGKLFGSRSYTYDAAGNPLSMNASTSGKNLIGWSKGDASGAWKETYSYDSRDRLTKACMDEACSRYYEYAYDPVGNRLSQTTQKATTRYAYDAADELQTETAGDKVTLYSYDANGNEIQAGDTSYAYNLENKLTSQKGAGKPVSYTYTGEGLVSTRRIPSETTSYAWDTSENLPELALETNSKGKKSQTSSYTYGAGPIGLVNEAGSYAFHTESLGSVVELSDTSGNSVESYRYSPYGEAYAPGDSAEASSRSSNPIRFTGQYFDSESDLYNMRARQYEPETGRFLQEDPLECDEGGSCGSTYVYVGDQPTVKVDPSGEKSMMGANTSGVSQVSCGSAGSCRSCFTTSIGGPKGTQGPQGDTKKKLYGNGCGPNGWIKVAIPDRVRGIYDFRKPCSDHDFCYGGYFGTPKPTCDLRFYGGMLKKCGKMNWWVDWNPLIRQRHLVCASAASAYYLAVEEVGCWSYYKNQMAKCPYSHRECRNRVIGNAGSNCSFLLTATAVH